MAAPTLSAAPPVATRLPQQAIVRAGRYDQVTSVMIALITVFVVAAIFLSTMVITKPRIDVLKETVPVEFIEDPGGDPEGNVTNAAEAGSGTPELTDVTTQADIPPDEVESVPREDSPVAISADIADQLPPEPSFVSSNQANATNTNSSTGSGGTGTGPGRLAGHGTGKQGGFPREERWFIRYADSASLDEYAKQLDFFSIELGAIVGKELVYISEISGGSPKVRRAPGGGNEKRLYFTWQGGNRRTADVQLFRKAGVNVGDGMIFQFYPKNTENVLANAEYQYEKRKYNEIRRTYFGVRKPEKGSGYEFYVTRQVTIR